jgi:Cu(I)/Ag(I) efflux system protein CusF
MKSLVISVALSVAGAGGAFAQNKPDGHSGHHATAVDMTDGEVRKVDKGASKVTIKHGEIKNLEMPPMTMVFQVKDAALLDNVKAGDKVKFRAEKAGSGYVVTAIEASP